MVFLFLYFIFKLECIIKIESNLQVEKSNIHPIAIPPKSTKNCNETFSFDQTSNSFVSDNAIRLQRSNSFDYLFTPKSKNIIKEELKINTPVSIQKLSIDLPPFLFESICIELIKNNEFYDSLKSLIGDPLFVDQFEAYREILIEKGVTLLACNFISKSILLSNVI